MDYDHRDRGVVVRRQDRGIAKNPFETLVPHRVSFKLPIQNRPVG